MKRNIFSRFLGGLGIALALLVGSSAHAFTGVGAGAAVTVGMMLDRLTVCDSYGAEATRFELEQAYMADTGVVIGALASSDLRREGHGYRQASAEENHGFGESITTV